MRPVSDLANRTLAEFAKACGERRFQDAEGAASELLSNAPRGSTDLFLLSDAAIRFHHVDAVIESLEQILEEDPGCSAAHVALANLYRTGGELDDALDHAKQAVNLEPTDPVINCVFGLCLLGLGRPQQSLKYLHKAVQDAPQVPYFHESLGAALKSLGALEEAAMEFGQAIQRAPDLRNPLWELGCVLRELGRPAEAVPFIQRAVQLAPTADGLYQIACALAEDRRHAEAEPFLRKAIELDPNHAGALEALGFRLQQLGSFGEADQLLQKAIAIDPDRAYAYYGIVQGKRITEDDRPLVDRMEELVANRGLRPEEQRYLRYALGKAHDDLAEFERAMVHFDDANRLSADLFLGGQPFASKKQHELFDRIISTFNPGLFARLGDLAVEDARPVFLVGTMRSGTTLVEQILSSHPAVAAGGEIVFWTGEEILRSTEALASGKADRASLSRIADTYRRILDDIDPTAARITDKMPLNFAALGMIRLLYPGAKVVHCRRDPLDTCLSIYTTTLRGVDFLYRRDSIASAYREYQRLMAHWRAVLPPEFLFELDYEQLVADPETVIRDMVAFCGLDWDDACLHHDRNVGDVATPSRWQARQPIYSTSVGRWRNYEPYLGEFLALRPQAVDSR